MATAAAETVAPAPALWMEDLYRALVALRIKQIQVVGWLLGKKQKGEYTTMLSRSPWNTTTEQPRGDFLWGKPIVWSEADDCVVPLMERGVNVWYDEERQKHVLGVPFRQREDGTWEWL